MSSSYALTSNSHCCPSNQAEVSNGEIMSSISNEPLDQNSNAKRGKKRASEKRRLTKQNSSHSKSQCCFFISAAPTNHYMKLMELDFKHDMLKSLSIALRMKQDLSVGQISHTEDSHSSIPKQLNESFFQPLKDVYYYYRRCRCHVEQTALLQHPRTDDQFTWMLSNFNSLSKQLSLLLLSNLEIVRNIILSIWKKIMSDYVTIFEQSRSEVHCHIANVVSLSRSFNNEVRHVESIITPHFDTGQTLLEYHFLVLKVNSEFRLLFISVQDLLRLVAEVRISSIYQSVMVKKSIGVVHLLHTQPLDQDTVEKSLSLLKLRIDNNTPSLISNHMVADSDISRSNQLRKQDVKLSSTSKSTYPILYLMKDSTGLSLNSCRDYVERILSEEYTFISTITEELLSCLRTISSKDNQEWVYESLPLISLRNCWMVSNPNEENGSKGRSQSERRDNMCRFDNDVHFFSGGKSQHLDGFYINYFASLFHSEINDGPINLSGNYAEQDIPLSTVALLSDVRLRDVIAASSKESTTLVPRSSRDVRTNPLNTLRLNSYEYCDYAPLTKIYELVYDFIRIQLIKSFSICHGMETQFILHMNEKGHLDQLNFNISDLLSVYPIPELVRVIEKSSHPHIQSSLLLGKSCDFEHILCSIINWSHTKVHELACRPSLKDMCVIHNDIAISISSLHLIQQCLQNRPEINSSSRHNLKLKSMDAIPGESNQRSELSRLYRALQSSLGRLTDHIYGEFENVCSEFFDVQFSENGGYIGSSYRLKGRRPRNGYWYRKIGISSFETNRALILSAIDAILIPALETLTKLNRDSRQQLMGRFVTKLVEVYIKFFGNVHSRHLRRIDRKRRSQATRNSMKETETKNMSKQIHTDYFLLIQWIRKEPSFTEFDKDHLQNLLQFFSQLASEHHGSIDTPNKFGQSLQSLQSLTSGTSVDSAQSIELPKFVRRKSMDTIVKETSKPKQRLQHPLLTARKNVVVPL